ncbi:hypothetical protein KIPB_003421 [Kipferlia bialata]|uniref:Kelch repeat type 1 n=1 Tax=Kipferlia bialata TaxID=797122 RepID=A0A9K3GF18_9EUKA|nr:hypothetical protein KIPB_000526 [Kipferlia bialata]GIQ82308.1 hypothetical protein KIPB_003421 [Kipferlia bialata]|eukprot:g526.t1
MPPSLVFKSHPIGHRGDHGALVYTGPLAPDGHSPAETLGEGEAYTALLLGKNIVVETHHCMCLSLDTDSGSICSEPMVCPLATDITYASATRIGDSVYVYGGHSGGVSLDTLHTYSIRSGEWHQIPKTGDWPSPRYCHTAFTLGGMLYIAGGYDDSGHATGAGCYDTVGGVFTWLPDPPSPFAYSCAVTQGERVLLIGSDMGEGMQHLSYTQAEGWCPERDGSAYGVYAAGAVSIRGTVYVIGGYTETDGNRVHILPQPCETDTCTWRLGEDMPVCTGDTRC